MLKLDVFAGTVSNLTDARYFAARSAKWLGFNMDQLNPNALSIMEVNAIKEWLDGVQIIGEFGDVTHEEITKTVEAAGLDGVLAGHFTSRAAIEGLNLPVFKEIIIDPSLQASELEAILESFEGSVAYFILDFDRNKVVPGGNISMEQLKALNEQYALVISFPWEKYSLDQALSDVDLNALLVRGGEEEKVGFKSFEDLDEILDALEIEEEY